MGRKKKIPGTVTQPKSENLSSPKQLDENGKPLSKTFREGRLLYKIGDVTKLIGLTPRTIRYYDQMGLLTHVKRSQGKVRLFDDKDIEILKRARKFQKEGMALEEIRDLIHGKNVEPPKIAIVTDSTAAIPWEAMNKFPVEVVPLKLKINNETFLDGDIAPQKFWEKTKNLEIRPATEHPTEGEFTEIYLKLAKKGFKKAFSIHLSSTLSDTYKVALSAAHKVADKIDIMVIDSRSTGAGLGLLVQLVAEAIQAKDSLEDIQRFIDQHIPLIYNVVTLNTLQFLMAGGIVQSLNTNQKNLLDKIFEFKPVISISGGKGEVEILECEKHKKDAIDFMVTQLDLEVNKRVKYVRHILIIYNYLYGEAIELINRVKMMYPTTPVYIQEGSSVLSVYVGPESIGVAII